MSSYTEGQIHQLANALEMANFSPDDVTKLGQFENLSEVRGLFLGTHEIKRLKHLIDCDASPFCPDEWKVEKHCNGGQLEWDVSKIQLCLSEKQKDGGWVGGNKLREWLEGKAVLNANVLDYLLRNTQLIPEEWKNKYVFFWGTIYRDPGGVLVVRCLAWLGGGWDWASSWLGSGFRDSHPAVLLAS